MGGWRGVEGLRQGWSGAGVYGRENGNCRVVRGGGSGNGSVSGVGMEWGVGVIDTGKRAVRGIRGGGSGSGSVRGSGSWSGYGGR